MPHPPTPPRRRGRLGTALGVLLPAALLAAAVSGTASAVTTREEVLRQALAGRTAPQILATAYPGARLAPAPGRRIRVLVGDMAPQVVLSGREALVLRDEGRPAAAPRTLPPGHRHVVRRVRGGMEVSDLDAPGSPPVRLRGPVLVDAGRAADGIRIAEPVELRYRGAVRLLQSTGRTLAIVNLVGVEDYVRGVLPGEMPPMWERRAPAALTAGAVAVRSAAIASLRRGGTFDVTVDEPLYLGLDGARPSTDAAVARTRRYALTLSGKVVQAAFPGVAPVVFTPDPGRPEPIAAVPAKPIPGAPAGQGGRALQFALEAVGTPYEWGGESPGGFDCSGLVFWAFGRVGITLPRVADDQARVGVPVPREGLRPGDAVFFADSSGYVHHMGLYIGGNRFVHAPRRGTTVRVDEIEGRYDRLYAGARRFSP